jgi:hypothetical protein
MVAAMPAPRHQRARGGAGGSRPLSSTGQKRNSNDSNSEYRREVQQRRPVGPPYVCSDRAPSAAWGCWQAPDSRRCIDAGQPVTCANRPVIGPMTLVAWSRPGPPGGPFLPTLLPHSQVVKPPRWASWPVRSPPRSRARWPGPRSLTAGSVRGLGASCRWCQSGAGPAGALRRSGTGLRRGAALGACRRTGAPHEEPGATRRSGRDMAPLHSREGRTSSLPDRSGWPAGWLVVERVARSTSSGRPQPSPWQAIDRTCLRLHAGGDLAFRCVGAGRQP